MIRINGKMLSGRTENEKVMIAHRILYDGLDGNEKLINLVMSLANQNLGIFMYEKLVRCVQGLFSCSSLCSTPDLIVAHPPSSCGTTRTDTTPKLG